MKHRRKRKNSAATVLSRAIAADARVERLEGRVLLASAGLVAALGFEEGSGATAADVSGSSNNGLINGATWTTSGKFGKALSFNGTSNTVTVADSNSLDLTTGMTLEAWVYPTTSTGKRDVIIKQGTNVDVYNLYERSDPSNGPESNVFVANANKTVQGTPLPVDTWTHLAGTYDGATLKLYVNGGQIGTLAVSGSITTSTGALMIGGNSLWGEYFQGMIDEVRIYNRALSATEIQSDMVTAISAPTGPDNTPPLVSSVTPLDTAINAGTGTNVTVVFNEAMNAATINASTIELRDPSGNLVPATVTYNPVNLTATLDPTGSLTVTNDFYAARVHSGASGVKDLAGNALAADYTWSFVTGNLNYQNEIVITNINVPTVMQFLPDGRMLVGELTGAIRIAQAGATQVNSTPLIQLTNINNDGEGTETERGLNGLTIDPNFASNGYIYVFYTSNTPLRDRVSRFKVTGNTADPASEFVVWQDNVAPGLFHHGGSINFGPDGKLYITTGDNWDDPASAQSLTSYHGKVLRVNADGTVPSDNPFYDGTGANLDAIWARGLRNPFHASFDSVTGRYFIGDVGGNDPNASWEELELGTAGANYGWSNYEGPVGQPGYTDPLFGYSHAGRDACIVAGFVYRGTSFPTQFQGNFFYGDYAQNTIRRLTFDASGKVTGDFPVDPPDGSQDNTAIGDPVCLTMGPDGALYYVDFGFSPTVNPAAIRRIRFQVTSNHAPTAVSAATPLTGAAPLTVSFSSAGSVDPDGQSLLYSWDFGDGTTSTQANPTHIYAVAGPYSARLTVSDGALSTLANPISISVGRPPVATITSPTNGITFRANDVINFTGTGTDPDDGNLPASAFSWTVVFHHDTHIHPVLGPLTGTKTGSFVVPENGHDFSDQTSFEIILTVTDSTGLQNTSSVTIFPQKVILTFATTPPGMQLLIDGLPHTAPFVLDSLIGFDHTIEAVATQTVGTSQYNYASWSDGGARVHTIVTPTGDTVYTANFAIASLPGPVAAFNFDETSGTSAADASGNGNTGTITGATHITSGKNAGALSFNGTSNLVTVADANSLDLSTGMTLEAWIDPTINTGVRDVIIKEGPNVDYYNMYARNGSGLPEGNVFAGSVNKTSQGTALPINTWTHMAATYDGASLILYINGVLAKSTAVTGAIPASTGALRIGGNSLWGEYFQGMIDDVRIYSRALSQAEVQTDMNTPVSSGPVNHAPVAAIVANPTSGAIPLTVNLSGTTSTDPDAGDTLTYAWDLDNNGQFNDSTSPTTQVIFTTSGVKTVRLQVTDSHGASSIATQTISASNPNNTPPIPTIDTPLSTQLWKVGDVIGFSGHATDTQDVTIPAASLSWSMILHDNTGDHVIQTFNGVASGTFTAPNAPYPSHIHISLTATDHDGAPATTTIELDPQTTNLSFATSAPGLQLTVNGIAATTPFSQTVIVNSINSVVATTPQTIGSTNYFFSSWSDGGATTHNITAPATNTIYTATYSSATGPVAAYNFEAGSGTVLTDVSGNGNNGTISGATWITTGKNGKALSFTANNQMVTIPDSASLHLTTGMTLEAWVYPTINTGTRDVLIKEGTGVDIYNLYERDDAGKPEGNVFAGGANKTAQGTALAINTWTHLATTYDGTNLKLFVNGVLVATTAVSGAISTSTGALRIGGNSIWGEWYRGRIDDIRIYNRALSAAEVTTDMNTAVAAAAAGLAAAQPALLAVPATPPSRSAVFATKKIDSLVSVIDTIN